MTAWHIAMLLVLPFMGSWPKGRTWAALMCAGVVPWLLPPMSVSAYIVVDALAGAVVLRHPAGCAQRAVGACFAMLVMYHVGFLASHNSGDASTYYMANVTTGWLQFALLAAWGLFDVGKAVLHRSWSWRGVSTPDARVR